MRHGLQFQARFMIMKMKYVISCHHNNVNWYRGMSFS